ncbi:L-aspartate oxidase [Marivivens donghaensis]|uniref:L-aspartate oxidase n=1 Tax=Marivivens donghaensis TaxID=1699413 RepID=UPI0032B2CCEA
MTHTIETGRIVIVGAGLGALYAALELAPRPVLMISPETLGQGASSAWAQGGVAAAMSADDSAAAHARDTVLAGAGTVDIEIAEMVTSHAREHILNLTDKGTPFDRGPEGGYVLSLEAAHSKPRVVRVKGDQAGAKIMETLIEVVRETPSVQVCTNTLATGLEVEDGVVKGVYVKASDRETEAVLIRCPAVLLAGGGSGGLFSVTTNPPRIRGQVVGLAARAGALVGDPEFVQFHPTAMDVGEDPAPLATEALRGEGAKLINADGERFMLAIDPRAELAPRDIVARGIFAETQAGRRPCLDTREVLGAEILTKFPVVANACARNGIDPVTEAIPVACAAHYHMGGIDADDQGRTSMASLWVCGEAASTGLHGANRLASNGLLEALVFARQCAQDITAQVPLVDAAEVELEFTDGGTDAFAPESMVALRKTMTDNVGVLRNAAGLQTALAEIARLEKLEAQSRTFGNMTATATLITAAALLREESRGGHFRTDFPEADPEQAHRTEITLAEALEIRARYAKE